jgi:hypothetical protein
MDLSVAGLKKMKIRPKVAASSLGADQACIAGQADAKCVVLAFLKHIVCSL